MSDAFPFKDLTDLVNQAHSGLKRDVTPLTETIAEPDSEGGFFLSLARDLGLPNELTLPDPEAPVSSHMLQHPDGSVYVCFFTRPEFVKQAQEQEKWMADNGKPVVCPLPARNALFYAWKLINDNEQVVGLFINPYQEKALMLNRIEIQNLFNGLPAPFEAYAQQTPLAEGESIMVRPADVSSVEGFTDSMQNFVETREAVKSYEVVALFDEQRNMEPYLAINFQVEAEADQYQALAEDFVGFLQEKVNFPERLEIMFNEKFPTLF